MSLAVAQMEMRMYLYGGGLTSQRAEGTPFDVIQFSISTLHTTWDCQCFG